MKHEKSVGLNPYFVLFFILGSTVAVTLLLQFWFDIMTVKDFMRIFMGLFFVVFGFFKILDWNGFAYAFAEYDIVASKVKLYAYAYPLIEFFLGLMYLSNKANFVIHTVTASIMFVGSIGVLLSLREKKEIQCACLGTVVKLPVSSITLIEDVGMGVMALYMMLM